GRGCLAFSRRAAAAAAGDLRQAAAGRGNCRRWDHADRRPGARRALPCAVLTATEDRGACRMITLYGEGRGFRVAWLLEELGVRYRLRAVDLLNGLEDDAEFLAVNP